MKYTRGSDENGKTKRTGTIGAVGREGAGERGRMSEITKAR